MSIFNAYNMATGETLDEKSLSDIGVADSTSEPEWDIYKNCLYLMVEDKRRARQNSIYCRILQEFDTPHSEQQRSGAIFMPKIVAGTKESALAGAQRQRGFLVEFETAIRMTPIKSCP